jgi:MFS transporter, DHA1 family, inner membrane transport protein
MTKKERIILFLLAGLNFTHILDFMIMMPLGNYLMPYFNISAKQFSFLVSAYSISAAVSGFIAAFIVDHFDRKKILVWCYIGFLLGTVACGLAPTYTLLFLARILAGIFGGIIGAQVFSIIADIFSYERRGIAMGSVMSAFAVASILGVPFSLYLTNIFHDDWHLPFLFVGGLGIILVPLMIKFIPPMSGHIKGAEEKTTPMELLRTILRTPAQWSALIFSCLLMMGHFLIIPFINPYLEFNKGFSRDLTPMIYLVGGSASLVAAIYLGKIADKKGKLPVFSISVFLSLFMVLIITKMPNVPFSVVLLFFAVWFVFATGRAVTAQAMISEVVKPEQRGSFMSFNGCVQQLGTSIASVAAGLIVVKDSTGKLLRYEWLGFLSILVLIGSLILGRMVFKNIDKTEEEIKLESEFLAEAEPV